MLTLPLLYTEGIPDAGKYPVKVKGSAICFTLSGCCQHRARRKDASGTQKYVCTIQYFGLALSVLTVHYGANVFIPLFSLRFFFKNPGKSPHKHTHTRAHTMIWNSAQPCIMYMLTTQTDALDFVKHGNSELKVRKSPDRKRAKKTPDHFFYLFILSSPRAKIYPSHTGAVQLNKQHIVSHL